MIAQNGMDPWLAQVYGTGATEDLEKTAQYMLLEKMAAAEGVDLSGLSPEQIDALAQQVSTDAGGADSAVSLPPEVLAEVQQLQAQGVPEEQILAALEQGGYLGGEAHAGEHGDSGHIPAEMLEQAGHIQAQQGAEPSAEMAKEAQAKFEEADFLGRVMAHSHHDEMRKIAEVDVAKETAEVAKKFPGLTHKVNQEGRGAVSRFMHGAGYRAAQGGRAIGNAAKFVGHHAAGPEGHRLSGGSNWKERAATWGTRAALTAGTAAAAKGVHHLATRDKGQEKTAGEQAIEQLAEIRAIELLREAGYDI